MIKIDKQYLTGIKKIAKLSDKNGVTNMSYISQKFCKKFNSIIY